jgi:hypothetical protein
MTNKKNPKTPIEYFCEECLFKCSNKKDYNRHILTAKHKILINTNKKTPKTPKYICEECGKEYKHSSSLSQHKKKCHFVGTTPVSQTVLPEQQLIVNTIVQKTLEQQGDLIQTLIERDVKRSEELKEAEKKQEEMLSLLKNISEKDLGSTVNNTNNTNTNNNTFNLSVFLNEECKDAMSIMDFVDSLEYRISNLDYIGQQGYVEGVSKVILDGLNELEINKRPIHCTDTKRRSLYLKYDNQWNKEPSDMHNMKKAIKYVAHNNIKKIPEWQESNPGHNKPETRKHKEYLNICDNVMSGSIDDDTNPSFKNIINKVSNATVIDKEAYSKKETIEI